MLDIKEGEKLSKYTTFNLGGAAKYFVAVKNNEDLAMAIKWAKENNQKYFVLGGGSNVFFGDEGFDGLVIKIEFDEINLESGNVFGGSGMLLVEFIKKAAEAGFGGLESLAGIPGTIGGATCGNAGAFGKSLSDVMEKAEIFFPLPDGNYKIEAVDNSWFQYDYRLSKLKYWEGADKPIILKVWFKAESCDKEQVVLKVNEILKTREAKQPKGYSAGCAFKNIKGPIVGELLEKDFFSAEEKQLFASRGAIPAGWFIDHAELKGKKINGAYVPSEHANYIMNDGTAKAGDIVALISYIKQQVRDKYGVQLEEEVQIII